LLVVRVIAASLDLLPREARAHRVGVNAALGITAAATPVVSLRFSALGVLCA
jgi:hypothetical protein